MLIINADDFGLNEQTNSAIMQSFKRGLCSSTTLMPNMPGFEEAYHLAHENKLTNHVGMHLVLVEGYPLTEKIKYFPRLCDKEGRLCLSRASLFPILRLETMEKEAISEEIRAQIKRCRAHGIPITHIDSHFHIHAEYGIATILIPLALEQRIPYIRVARNCGPGLGPLKKVYKYILNYRLEIANLARTEYFGSPEDFIFLKSRMGLPNAIKSFEVMIHPCFNDKQTLVDGASNTELEEVVKNIDSYEDAVSFNGVKYL